MSAVAASEMAQMLPALFLLLRDPIECAKAQFVIGRIEDALTNIRVIAQLYEAVLAGDIDAAQKIQEILAGNVWPSSIKRN